MEAPDVETRISHTSTARFNNGRGTFEGANTTVLVGPRTSAGRFTLLHLAEVLEQARKQGAPMDTGVYFGDGLAAGVDHRPHSVRVSFTPEPQPEASDEPPREA